MTLRQSLVAVARGAGSLSLKSATAAKTRKGSVAISIATSHGRKTLARARFKGSGVIKVRFVLTHDGRLRVRNAKTLRARLVITAVGATGVKVGRTMACRLVWNA